MADDARDPRKAGPAAKAGEAPVVTDELRRALEGLRSDIRTRLVKDRSDATASPGAELEQLFHRTRRRIGTLGMSEHSAETDEFGMDHEALRRVGPVLDFLYERYWRLALEGLEHLPQDEPCVLVANRAGLVPWDGLMLAHALARTQPAAPRPRFLVADAGLRWPFVQATIAQLGGVRACPENAMRLLASGRSVIAFPEGAQGSVKAWRDRYQLARFEPGGAVALALASGAPLVPVGIVGAEEVHPLLLKLEGPARRVGLPFVPVTPTFPLLGVLGLLPLPSKWTVRLGEPIPLAHLDASDERAVAREDEALRERIDALVQAVLLERESIWS
jgi:1-acyl-sn-glycerol-3-phosphate acyltransferase